MILGTCNNVSWKVGRAFHAQGQWEAVQHYRDAGWLVREKISGNPARWFGWWVVYRPTKIDLEVVVDGMPCVLNVGEGFRETFSALEEEACKAIEDTMPPFVVLTAREDGQYEIAPVSLSAWRNRAYNAILFVSEVNSH